MTTAKQERRSSLRKHLADFGDDLTEGDKQRLFFLYRDHIPRGTQEELKSAVQIFQHLYDKAVLDFDEPITVVEMMRGLNKERWALETEKKFGCKSAISSGGCTDFDYQSIQQPEQESRVSLPVFSPPPTTSTTVVVRREPQSPDSRLSNSLKRRLHLDPQKLAEFNKLVAQNQSSKTSAAMIPSSGPTRTSGTTYTDVGNTTSHELDHSTVRTSPVTSKSGETVEPDGRGIPPPSMTDVRMRTGSQTATHPPLPMHTKLTRNPSNVSKRSNHSSGYYSGVPEEILDGDDEDEESEESEYDFFMRHQEQFYSPQDSCSTSRCSTLGSMPRSPSGEGYLTADDGDQETNGHALGSSHERGHSGSPSPSNYAGHHNLPRQSFQKLEGEMEVQVKDLQKAVEKSRIKSFRGVVHKSCPFPYFNSDKGVTFQIHLYPISLGSPSSCAVYLVVLGWSPDAPGAVPLPKFEINVSVAQSTAAKSPTLGGQVDETVVKTESLTVDVMDNPLPPTPSDVNYTNIALFPSLLSHTELDQLDSKSIYIRASLSFCASNPS